METRPLYTSCFVNIQIYSKIIIEEIDLFLYFYL
jgi:hypothetical protein